MLPDGPSEMEQLDVLATELGEAGRIARMATAQRGRPDPVFSVRLRAELLGSFGSIVPVSLEPVAGNLIEPLAPEAMPELRVSEQPDVLAAASAEPGPGPAVAPAPLELLEDRGHAGSEPTRLRPSVTWRIPTRAMPSRWVGVGLAACLALAAFLAGSGVLWPARPPARADDAVAATLVRGQDATPLLAGAELSRGDEIRVAQGGRAYLTLGSSYVRLDGGADVRLDSVDASNLEIAQLAGRVYHRVQLPDGGMYRVVTGDVTWRAKGTAFDINRESNSSGEQVVALALQHDVAVSAPGYYGAVRQGSSATFVLSATGAAGGEPTVSTIPAGFLSGPWLLANAQLDSRLGLPLGELANVQEATPSPTASPTPQETPTPVVTPAAPTETPTPAPTATPAKAPTPKPTAIPTPKPVGPPNLGNLAIAANGNGTYTFSWPRYTGTGFQYYKLVYGKWGTQPTYNGSNDWACPSSVDETSWTGSVAPGDYAVRVQVIDKSTDKIVVRAQTPVVRLTVAVPPTVSLGGLNVIDNGGGTYTFSWNRYSALPFDYYKLVYEPYPGAPSYPGGSSYWAVPGCGETSVTVNLAAGGFVPGDWNVRIQAIGYPGGHAYAYAQTDIYRLTIAPPPTPTPAPTPTPTPTATPTA
jgi:hypothetical protein